MNRHELENKSLKLKLEVLKSIVKQLLDNLACKHNIKHYDEFDCQNIRDLGFIIDWKPQSE